MRTTKFPFLVALSAMTALALSGCASDGGSGAAPEGTVAIDVGDDKTVNLSTEPGLKVAVFIPGTANEYSQVLAQAAEETSEELGLDMTLFDAGYVPNEQLNQMQTALQSGDYDAAVVYAYDGTILCKIATEEYADANILVVNAGTTLCDAGVDETQTSTEDVWSPGTMNFVGSNNTRAYIDGWFKAVGEANPGKQKALAVFGPAVGAQTHFVETSMTAFAADNPDYEIESIYTDYSTSDAFNQTQTYLQGHPDTSLILSMYSPDVSRGIVEAVDAAGLTGKINIADQGFGYSVAQIEQGTIQLSTLFFPYNLMRLSLQSIVDAQSGDAGPRFVDDSVVGSAEEPFVVTKDTIADLPEELR